MFRATRWLLIPCLAAFIPAQSGEETKPQNATGKKPTLVQKLLDADDEQRPEALIAVIEDQIATQAIYAGQYKDLIPVREKATPLLSEWIIESPDRVKDDGQFRAACINVLRDLIEKDASEALAKSLLELAEDQFEDQGVRDYAMYALAQFGNRKLVDARIAAAMKQTSLPDLNQQYRGWNALCDIYYQLRSYESAVQAYRKTITLLENAPQPPAGIGSVYYNFACSLALAGQTEEALQNVEKALKAAKTNGQPLSRRMLDTDMDIVSLRKEERFAELIAEYYGDGKKSDDKDG